MYVVYGIPNCDTIKKTLDWLNEHKISYSFHDYKKEGISMDKLKAWSKQVGWETIFNKKSTVWKELGAEAQAKVVNEKTALPVLKENTSIIKRPVIELNSKIVAVGFKEAEFKKVFMAAG
ncbi:Spx/MgsR family RNA polymerase-binding regulatory protein [Foetidibacter luteolus]|uniref:Spx/MgsR family RNA polymerase-binding regulatory protein n=1 Tax=Foetidibacter luteolus TaxID=2608880 RepID=UPI00129BEBE8|nr:Spx/MgsR family RNA polymerase-binding regulatory protein [Foetidibacter luteolus]